MNNKVLTLLGFASKAGKLCYGMEAAVYSIKSGKSRLVVVASDISVKSKKEVSFFAEKESVKQLILNDFNIKAVSDAVGRKCGIVSIIDSGFADAVLKAYVEGGNANDE